MNNNSKRLISIAIPVYNEEDNVNTAYERIAEVFKDNKKYDIEYIFTDNHSEDSTFDKLNEIAQKDLRVRVLRFNRNYGFQRSLMTGYRLAKGDAVVQIDCDMQDPPELILEFIERWQQGHDVVVGLRRRREENRLLSLGRRAYYAFINNISDDQITRDAGDFRLIDRSVLDRVISLNDNNPYLRGLTSAFSKNETGIVYDRKKREFGKSKFPFFRLLNMASDSVFSMTLFPLKLSGYISFLVSLFTILLALYYFVSALFFGADWPDGFATLVLLLLLSISLNVSLLAIAGKYIGQIYTQQQNKPIVIVENFINVDGTNINEVEKVPTVKIE